MHWCFLCYVHETLRMQNWIKQREVCGAARVSGTPILLSTAAFHPWLISRSDWSKSPRNHQIQSCDPCGCPAIKENLRSSYSPFCRRNCRGGRELIAPEDIFCPGESLLQIQLHQSWLILLLSNSKKLKHESLSPILVPWSTYECTDVGSMDILNVDFMLPISRVTSP